MPRTADTHGRIPAQSLYESDFPLRVCQLVARLPSVAALDGLPRWQAVQRGIAVQIPTFGLLERRFGVSLKDILKHFPSAARPHTHVLPIRPLGVT